MDNNKVTPYAIPDPEFTGLFSSDDIWYAGETNIRLTDVIDDKLDANHTHDEYARISHSHNEYASVNHLHEEYAEINHVHNDYATVSDVASNIESLQDAIDDKANINHAHTGYATMTDLNTLESQIANKANSNHSHSSYVTTSTLNYFVNEVSTALTNKANVNHTHSEYAAASHVHDEYALQTSVDTLAEEINDKADASHTHSEYSFSFHTHDEYAEANHAHSEYSPAAHTHDDYATTISLDELSTVVSGKADAAHEHDDCYYTESEIDIKLDTKSDVGHSHEGEYDVSGSAAIALSSANAYTDLKIDALVGDGASTTLDTIGEISSAIEDNQDAIDLLNSAIANKANASALAIHASDTEIHITDAERASWNAKSNFSGNYDDLTNKPAIPSINGLATEVYVNTQISAIDIPSSLSDLTTDSTHRVVTDAEKSTWNAKSDFSGSYNDLTDKPSIPSISGLATKTYVDEVVSTKANSSHTHDDRYYTETEINTKLSAKSDSTHNHNTSYDVLGAANTALVSAKEYTDDAIADEVVARDSAIATAKNSAISTAVSDAATKANNALASAKTYADSVGENVKNDLLGNAGAAYDTLKELGDLIDDNIDAIEALKAVAAGKANASHAHAISDVTNLQSTLDGKAATSHGTHVSYSTTAPVMDGSASVGAASTVARSDHKHPTDTSRAAQTSLDSHTGNKFNPHGVTLSQLGVTATAAELNYIDGVTSNVQTQLNGKAASGHIHDAATTSTAGFMTAAMFTKLNGIATGANAYAHPTYTARTGVPTANQTPAFGGTFTVSQPVSDGTGHITAVNSRTITIPSAVATSSANGLMSKSDKSKLDGIVLATVSEVETYLGI